MIKTALILICLLQGFFIYAQSEPEVKTINVDLNNNGITDNIKPTENGLEMVIDNKKQSIDFHVFSCCHLL